MARQAQEALARQQQAQAPKPALLHAPAPPTSRRRSLRVAGVAVAAVVLLVLLGVTVARGRGPAAAAEPSGTDATQATQRAAGTDAPRSAGVPTTAPKPATATPPAPVEAAGGQQQASQTAPAPPAVAAAPPTASAETSEAAVEHALSELLRQIGGSPELGEPAKVSAAIRKRCWDNPTRYEDGRRLLATFEKEWGRKGPGKTWVPVLREALAYPPRQDWTVPDLGLELVWVAPGSFQMGSTELGANERPVHAVEVSRGFWLGKYEVTQSEYEALMGKNPSKFKGARNPVEMVSWNDAVAFCTKLTEREQRAERLPERYEYRLPTEAEWEYAARGGAKSQATPAGSGQDFIYSGSNNVDEVAWYYGNSGDRRVDDSETDPMKRKSNLSSNSYRTHPVGQKKPNELGLYDLSGNVWEWCLDGYDKSYYSRSPGVDPVNLEAADRVGRGGSWFDGARSMRPANRNGGAPGRAVNNLGFRACLAPRSAGK